MKTILTTLPIYKNRASQAKEKSLANGSVIFAPILCPRYRLPSFQWLDDGDGATAVTLIELVNKESSLDITSYFVDLPDAYAITDDTVFMYTGQTLIYPLPCGDYFLRITMDSDHVYYSDWFHIDLLYNHVMSTFTNVSFDTLTMDGREVVSCIDAGSDAYADSTKEFAVYKGQTMNVVCYVTNAGATLPSFSVVSATKGVVSDVQISSAGLNVLLLTMTDAAEDCLLRMQSVGGTCNFQTEEILAFNNFCDDYIVLSFTSCCNFSFPGIDNADVIPNLHYSDGFIQTIWLESDIIEQTYPFVERGQENGYGVFIPTFRKQDKIYSMKTKYQPQYMVDVFHRLKMHDILALIDQVGDEYEVVGVEVDHEWQGEDLYYAFVNLQLNLGETFVTGGCCTL